MQPHLELVLYFWIYFLYCSKGSYYNKNGVYLPHAYPNSLLACLFKNFITQHEQEILVIRVHTLFIPPLMRCALNLVVWSPVSLFLMILIYSWVWLSCKRVGGGKQNWSDDLTYYSDVYQCCLLILSHPVATYRAKANIAGVRAMRVLAQIVFQSVC